MHCDKLDALPGDVLARIAAHLSKGSKYAKHRGKTRSADQTFSTYAEGPLRMAKKRTGPKTESTVDLSKCQLPTPVLSEVAGEARQLAQIVARANDAGYTTAYTELWLVGDQMTNYDYFAAASLAAAYQNFPMLQAVFNAFISSGRTSDGMFLKGSYDRLAPPGTAAYAAYPEQLKNDGTVDVSCVAGFVFALWQWAGDMVAGARRRQERKERQERGPSRLDEVWISDQGAIYQSAEDATMEKQEIDALPNGMPVYYLWNARTLIMDRYRIGSVYVEEAYVVDEDSNLLEHYTRDLPYIPNQMQQDPRPSPAQMTFEAGKLRGWLCQVFGGASDWRHVIGRHCSDQERGY